jgi:hypothetical protein
MAPLLARRSKGDRGGVGSGSTELAEVLALAGGRVRLWRTSLIKFFDQLQHALGYFADLAGRQERETEQFHE